MQTIANVLVAALALLQSGFMVLEMSFWTSPFMRGISGLDMDVAKQTAGVGANQGLYNGFLAAGLIWGLCAPGGGLEIKLFFLACMIVAGIFAWPTVDIRIFYAQACPAMLALLLVWMARQPTLTAMPPAPI